MGKLARSQRLAFPFSLRHIRHSRYAAEVLERRLILSAAVAPVIPPHDSTGVSSQLLQLLGAGPAGVSSSGAGGSSTAASSGAAPLAFDSSGRVKVQITADDVSALETPLAALGFVQLDAEPALHFMDGYLPIAALNTISSLSTQGLMGVVPEYAPITSAGK